MLSLSNFYFIERTLIPLYAFSKIVSEHTMLKLYFITWIFFDRELIHFFLSVNNTKKYISISLVNFFSYLFQYFHLLYL